MAVIPNPLLARAVIDSLSQATEDVAAVSGGWQVAGAVSSAMIVATLTGKSVNGVTLSTAGAATTYLNGAGTYTNLGTFGYTAKTANYTIVPTTDNLVNCTSNSFAVTLPTAVGISGQEFTIKNSGSGAIAINTTSAQTVDGGASGSISLIQYESLTVRSDGANWIIK